MTRRRPPILPLIALISVCPAAAAAAAARQARVVAVPAGDDPRAVSSVSIDARVRLAPDADGAGLLIADATTPAADPARWDRPDAPGTIGIGLDAAGRVTLHADGAERLRRRADLSAADVLSVSATVAYVPGGAEVTVRVGEQLVYDKTFLAGPRPAAPRVTLGGADAASTLSAKAGPALPEPMPEPVRLHPYDRTPVGGDARPEAVAIVDFSRVPADVARVVATIAVDGTDPTPRRAALYLYGADGQRYEVARLATAAGRPTTVWADVTDLLPLFRDQGRLGFWVDGGSHAATVTLAFHPGRPARRPIAVANLWQGEPVLGDARLPVARFLDEKLALVPKTARSAKVRITATGHGHGGEYARLRRTLTIGTATHASELSCDEDDATSRSGWCPGRLVDPWEVEVAPATVRGRPHLTLSYGVEDLPPQQRPPTADPPTHWVEGQIVFYDR